MADELPELTKGNYITKSLYDNINKTCSEIYYSNKDRYNAQLKTIDPDRAYTSFRSRDDPLSTYFDVELATKKYQLDISKGAARSLKVMYWGYDKNTAETIKEVSMSDYVYYTQTIENDNKTDLDTYKSVLKAFLAKLSVITRKFSESCKNEGVEPIVPALYLEFTKELHTRLLSSKIEFYNPRKKAFAAFHNIFKKL